MGLTCKLLLAAGVAAAMVVGDIGTAVSSESFTYAIIADPHIDGNTDHPIELLSAVNHVIATKNDYNTQFAFVVGDIGWEQSNFNLAKGLFDGLNTAGVPYLPMIGDNESQYNGPPYNMESKYTTTFAPQYSYLSGILPANASTPHYGASTSGRTRRWGSRTHTSMRINPKTQNTKASTNRVPGHRARCRRIRDGNSELLT